MLPATSAEFPRWLTHPITIYFLQLNVSAAVLGFTSPGALLRLAVVPFQFILAWMAYQHTVEGLLSVFITSSVFLAVLVNPIMYIEKTLISRWDFEAGGPTRFFSSDSKGPTHDLGKDRHQSSLWDRYKFGFKTASSARHLNTPYEAKNSPHFSSDDKSYVPSRRAYILTAFITALLCYAFLDLTELAEQLQPPEASAFLSPDFAPVFSRLDQITVPEFVIRCITVLMVPINTWCIVQILYNTLGILHVATGLSDVQEWRPAFGPLLEVYTLQQFWGSFWHQFLRIVLFRPGAFLAHNVLGLPRRGVIPACIKVFFVFFWSGVLHTIFDLACHHSLGQSGALRFFCMQALGVVAESVVQMTWRQALEPSQSHKDKQPGFKSPERVTPIAWKRVVGLVWVAIFMVWTVPGWMYIHVSSHHTRILPFSILDSFVEQPS